MDKDQVLVSSEDVWTSPVMYACHVCLHFYVNVQTVWRRLKRKQQTDKQTDILGGEYSAMENIELISKEENAEHVIIIKL